MKKKAALLCYAGHIEQDLTFARISRSIRVPRTIGSGLWNGGLYWDNTCVPGAERLVSWVEAEHTSVQKVRLTEKQNKRAGEGVSLEISNCLTEPTRGDFCGDEWCLIFMPLHYSLSHYHHPGAVSEICIRDNVITGADWLFWGFFCNYQNSLSLLTLCYTVLFISLQYRFELHGLNYIKQPMLNIKTFWYSCCIWDVFRLWGTGDGIFFLL